MEIANIAFHLERSGKHTMLTRHMKRHNFMDKVSGLLDEKRGKRSILGRYLNDVVRQTPYIKQEDFPNDWAILNEGKYTGISRQYNVPGNHDDYMDLNYCGDIQTDSDESSLVEDADEYIRGSGDGSETPNSEETVSMDTVTKGHIVCDERIVIGAETYECRHVISTSNHADLPTREIRPTAARRINKLKRNRHVKNPVINDHTSKKFTIEERGSSGNEQMINNGPLPLETRDNQPSCHQTMDGGMTACYCASQVSPRNERKSDTKMIVRRDVKDVTSLKTALKKKTTNKLKVLFTMYKTRKTEMKKCKKLLGRIGTNAKQEVPVREQNMLSRRDSILTQNMSQSGDYSEIDNFNFAFCDESSRVVESRDHKMRQSTFTIRTNKENLIIAHNDNANRLETKTEQSYLCVSGQSTCEDYAYFNDGFILE